MDSERNCTLHQLVTIFKLDYRTLRLLKRLQFNYLKKKQYIDNRMIEELLVVTKNNSFKFIFETNPGVEFFDRMFSTEIYDIRTDPNEWIPPKTVLFLLDIKPTELNKLRKLNKIISKPVLLPYRKPTSKNVKINLYHRPSIIDYINNSLGNHSLTKEYKELSDKPQFMNVQTAKIHLMNHGIHISQATLYRDIEKSLIPTNRFVDSIRIPILELNELIKAGVYNSSLKNVVK
ncbi:MAG: hypothetical protein JWM44_2099 [Bacilli bacterium]|nr:hypothetical protein [Bacilli bacterium]